MQWAAIHEFLGRAAGELAIADVKAAVEGQAPESDRLDWKQVPPRKPKNGRWNEFAKDVAAMANTRGGLLEKIEYARLLKEQGESFGKIVAKTVIPKTSLHHYLDAAETRVSS